MFVRRNMKNNTITFSLPAIKKAFFAAIHRFHVIIFVVVVLGGLVVVVFLLNKTIVASEQSSDYTPPGTITGFDEATMKRIEELRTRDQSTNLQIPPGVRSNPFVE